MSKHNIFQRLRWASIILLVAGFGCSPAPEQDDDAEDAGELAYEPKPCGPEIAKAFDSTASEDELDSVIGVRDDIEGYAAGPRIRIRGKVLGPRKGMGTHIQGDGDEPFLISISLIESDPDPVSEFVTVEGCIVRKFASVEGRDRRQAVRKEKKLPRQQSVEGIGYHYFLIDPKVVGNDAGSIDPPAETPDGTSASN